MGNIKKGLLVLSTILFVIIINSCKDYNVDNPVGPKVIPANPNGLQAISFSESNLNVSWIDNEELLSGTIKIVRFEQSIDNGLTFTTAGYDTVENNEAEISTIFLCDTTYTFRICVNYGGNNAGTTSTIQKKLILMPTNITAVFNSDTTATISWKDNSNFETGYDIQLIENENVILTKSIGANYSDAIIKYNYLTGKTYKFSVRAKSEYNYSGYVSAFSQFTLNAPTNLQITNFIDTEIVLAWTDNSSLETSFEIEKSEDGIVFSLAKTIGANLTTATIEGTYLTTKQYYFRVRGKTSVNYSGYTNTVNSIIQFNAPTNLYITNFAESIVVLSWADNSNYESGFEIEKSEDGIVFSLAKTIGANLTTATIEGIYLTTKQYYFRVRGKTSVNYSGYTNTANSTLQFNAPTNLKITIFVESEAVLTWTDNSNYETGFEIYKSSDGINYSLEKTVPANTTSANIPGTYPSLERFYFKIRAKSNYNNSKYSVVVTGCNINPEMVTVSGGTFNMGNNGYPGYTNERPEHAVTLNSYKIGKYEVTQKLWVAVFGTNPSYFKGDNLPVEQVSWDDIQIFITNLNQKTGKHFRLPTEAEWEFAARGGNSSNGFTYSGSNTIGDVAWYRGNCSSKTHIVGIKQANELGLFDMSGNVWEWVNDWYSDTYYSISPSNNPQGPSSGMYRVLRGGSWFGADFVCHSVTRYWNTPNVTSSSIGFRLAEDL
ncbi:MAG: SUMF1/EgtB/PvdO family nonheme iron enzyme [bacterium]